VTPGPVGPTLGVALERHKRPEKHSGDIQSWQRGRGETGLQGKGTARGERGAGAGSSLGMATLPRHAAEKHPAENTDGLKINTSSPRQGAGTPEMWEEVANTNRGGKNHQKNSDLGSASQLEGWGGKSVSSPPP